MSFRGITFEEKLILCILRIRYQARRFNGTSSSWNYFYDFGWYTLAVSHIIIIIIHFTRTYSVCNVEYTCRLLVVVVVVRVLISKRLTLRLYNTLGRSWCWKNIKIYLLCSVVFIGNATRGLTRRNSLLRNT